MTSLRSEISARAEAQTCEATCQDHSQTDQWVVSIIVARHPHFRQQPQHDLVLTSLLPSKIGLLDQIQFTTALIYSCHYRTNVSDASLTCCQGLGNCTGHMLSREAVLPAVRLMVGASSGADKIFFEPMSSRVFTHCADL